MKIRSMIAAAMRPWVSVRREDGFVDIRVGGESVMLVASSVRMRRLRIGSWTRQAQILIGRVFEADEWRAQYVDHSLSLSGWSAHVESSEDGVAMWFGERTVSRHQLMVQDADGCDFPFHWGEPTIDVRIGDLKIRVVSRQSNESGYASYLAKKAAETPANDSAAAA